MIKTLLGVAGAGWLLWRWQQARRREDGAGPQVTTNHPRALNTWENEGGALPDTGPQLTSAAAPAESSGSPVQPANQPA